MDAWRFSVTIPQWLALKSLGRLNRGLYYRGPLATVKLAQVDEPRIRGPRWVKMKTLLCGFCASDLNLIFLRDSPTASPFTSFPCTFGHEICAEVVEVGSGVKRVKVGDVTTVAPALSCAAREMDPPCPACAAGMPANCENYANGDLAPGMFTGICRDTGGGFSPFFIAHESQLFPLPIGVSRESGAMIEPMTVGIMAVADNTPLKGENVLVIGGGVIGSLVVQAIRALEVDCRVTVSDPSPLAADLAKSAGADQVITDGDLFGGAVRLAGAARYKPMMGPDILMGGFHRIYDTVADNRTMNAALRCLAAGGTLSVVGIGHDVKLDLTPLWLKRQTVKGVFGCGYMDLNGERRHMFDVAIDWVKEGRVRLEQMVTHKFSLSELDGIIETNLNKSRHRAVKTAVSFL